MKLKPTDLRIGNYYRLDKSVSIDENVLRLEMSDIRVNKNICRLINPIPLTEEWLLNFDFYKGKKFYSDGHICLESLDEGGFKFSLFPDEDENQVVQYASTPMDAQSIHYVHQLQNLYWAITGEEITLNPDL